MYWLAAVSLLAIQIMWSHLPLAALISLQTLQNALRVLGYPAVTIFIMIESSGIPFPGETMLLLASFYAAIDHQLNIVIIIICAVAGAIAGDNLGYLAGRTGGRAFVLRFGRYVFLKPEHLDRAEKFFARHGDKTVFFGRFIAILRAWAAFLAGVNHMRWRNFVVYNAAGGILWATIYGTLGYVAGGILHNNFGAVERLARDISWTGAILIVAAIIVVIIVFQVRRARVNLRRASTDKEQPSAKITRPLGSVENGNAEDPPPAPESPIETAPRD